MEGEAKGATYAKLLWNLKPVASKDGLIQNPWFGLKESDII